MAETTTTTIKFGILGCAEIARKLTRAITLAPNATLFAIGSRSLEKALQFASDNNLPKEVLVYGSYEDVLNNPDVDAVYIPLPTGLHIHWAVEAAKKKKHVLLEKPVALNVSELDAIVEACEENGVQFMDGTMWMHHPRTAVMREFLSDQSHFGELRSMHTCFTMPGDSDPDFLADNIRVKPDLDGLGALGDAGWYCIRAILWAHEYQLPKTVTALPGPVLNEAGVIMSCGATLYWGDGRVATFHCSFLSHLTMSMNAIGSKGTLHAHDFIVPFQEKEAFFIKSSASWFNESVTGWVNKPSEQLVKTDLPQEALMVKEFSRIVGDIKENGSKPEMKWPTISRKTQLIIDSVKSSIERGFEPIKTASD